MGNLPRREEREKGRVEMRREKRGEGGEKRGEGGEKRGGGRERRQANKTESMTKLKAEGNTPKQLGK